MLVPHLTLLPFLNLFPEPKTEPCRPSLSGLSPSSSLFKTRVLTLLSSLVFFFFFNFPIAQFITAQDVN